MKIRPLALTVCALLCGTALLGRSQEPPDEGKGGWRISIGPIWRRIESSRFWPGDHSDEYGIGNQARRGHSGGRADIGPADAVADREYDDGFVRMDPGTARDLDTWYWGYENAAQHEGDQMVFTASDGISTRFRRTVSSTPGTSIDIDDTGVGLMIAAYREFLVLQQVSLGLYLDLMGIRFSLDGSTSTYSENQVWSHTAVSYEDRYDLLGVQPPGAPYEGNYGYPPGPLLPNIPAQRLKHTESRGGGSLNAYNTVLHDIDVELLTLSMGLRAETELGPVVLSGAAGPTLNLIAIDAEHSESLYVSRNGGEDQLGGQWHNGADETVLRAGAFVQAALGVVLTSDIVVDVFGRYDWVADVEGTVGPSQYDISLEGFSAGAQLAWRFGE
jgi:hypothetical protein